MRSRTSASRRRPRLRRPSAPLSRAPFLSPLTGAGPRDRDHATLATPLTSPRTRNHMGVYHNVRLPPTSDTPHACSRVGGAPRRLAASHHLLRSQLRGGIPQHSATTHPLHPLRSLSRGGCTTMLGCHPSCSLSCGGTTTLGHHPPTSYTPRARNCVGGC
jgi:hypothetical protein